MGSNPGAWAECIPLTSAGIFEGKETAQMVEKTHKRLVLTRSIVLNGEHADKGSTHDVPNATAIRLIGEGSAELAEGEVPETNTSVNRMAAPSNRDPQSKQVAPAPAKVKA